MKVSIIIPMYNESRYIARCLDSLSQQSYKDFEIILIDDWSKDDTVKIAEWYKNIFELTILHQKHWWPGKARNRWAEIAKWDILVFFDADMYFDKDIIKMLLQPILEGKEIGTIYGNELVGNLENKIARAYWIIRWEYNPNKTRLHVYRAIMKNIFLESWWFDSSKWYFDDDLSKINNWKWSLAIEKAICYHNNPENIHEVYKHSIWVWKWLIEDWQMKNYMLTYKKRIIAFIVLLIVLGIYIYKIWLLAYLPIILMWIILLLILIKTIQRTIKEKYLSHMIFVPIVIIARWIGYFVWICTKILKI